jgi:hypothetical protein
LSVLTFASAIARVFCGSETTTRATPRHQRLEQPHSRVRVAGRLDRHLILRPDAVGEHPQALVA